MFNIQALISSQCKRCLSLNRSKHWNTDLTVVLKSKYAGICSYYTPQNRCHSTEQAQNAGVEPSNESVVATNHDQSVTERTTIDVEPTISASELPRTTESPWTKPDGMDTGIMLYNSLTNRKEPLVLPHGKTCTWYQCGPTVYDNAHIGHASSYIRSDLIRRVMMGMFNIDIVLVMGITDIDDKIIKRAQQLRYPNFLKLTQQYEASFFRDLDALKILRPTVTTKVTDHIPHIIKFIQKIIDNGYAYTTSSGSVYFDVQTYGKYGRLGRHSIDPSLREPDSEKRHVRDFALWKAAKADEPFWESPFGKGRPGWHIECSTMASAIFGKSLDIHSGGEDLRFPHHENEIAQSETCHCTNQWSNYWIHTGSLHLRDAFEKMSKSLKNTISVHELLQQYTANQFRLFCMLRPYRRNIEFSDEAMVKAVMIQKKWTSFLNLAETYIKGQLMCYPINEPYLIESLEKTKVSIEKALANDFDFPKAVSELSELVHRANKELSRRPAEMNVSTPRSPGTVAGIVAYVERIMDLFGLEMAKKKMTQEGFPGSPFYQPSSSLNQNQLNNVLNSVVKFRKNIRHFALNPQDDAIIPGGSDKDHRDSRKKQMQPLLQACDDLRDDLKLSGIQVVDHGKESSWDLMDKSPVPEPSKRKT